MTLRDRKTGRVYEEFHGWYDATNVFIQQLRDRNPDVSVLGFRIMSGSSLKSFVSQYAKSSNENYEKVQRQWKKDRCSIIPEPISFTSLYAISNNALDDTTNFNVESGAKKGEITRAFKKMLSNKSITKNSLILSWSILLGYLRHKSRSSWVYKVLPDKQIQDASECCQMLSIVASDKWGHGFGELPKINGEPYKTDKVHFTVPCTIWAGNLL